MLDYYNKMCWHHVDIISYYSYEMIIIYNHINHQDYDYSEPIRLTIGDLDSYMKKYYCRYYIESRL